MEVGAKDDVVLELVTISESPVGAADGTAATTDLVGTDTAEVLTGTMADMAIGRANMVVVTATVVDVDTHLLGGPPRHMHNKHL